MQGLMSLKDESELSLTLESLGIVDPIEGGAAEGVRSEFEGTLRSLYPMMK